MDPHFVWSWLCSNLCLYDIDLRCISGIYVQVWILYHMDIRCILVAMAVHSCHGSALYWSVAMVKTYFLMSQNYWCITDSRLMLISDQDNSFLEVITCSIKALAYRILLASCFGGHFVTHKSQYHYVMRSQTSVITLNPKLLLDIERGVESV